MVEAISLFAPDQRKSAVFACRKQWDDLENILYSLFTTTVVGRRLGARLTPFNNPSQVSRPRVRWW